MRRIFLFLVLFLPAFEARAVIPPCNFMIKKLTDKRPMKKNALVYLSLFKPAENAKSSDQLLGTKTFFVDAEHTESSPEIWPSLSLLLESRAEKLIHKLRVFGFALLDEKDLLVNTKDEYERAKEIPQPFYRSDKEASLHRYRNAYAWVCENEPKDRSIWMDKDSFSPLEIRGPCPESLGRSNSCALELQNTVSLQETKNARMLLKRNGKLLYILKFDHVIFNPSATQWTSAKESSEKSDAEDESFRALESMLR